MLHAIVDIIAAIAALVAILDYFGIKPNKSLWGLSMPLSRRWKLGIMIGLVVVSLAMSTYGFYRALRPIVVEKTVTVENTVAEPYPFRWLGDNPVKYHVIGKHFFNEKVLLDDTEYTNCTFENVTFVYNGTAPYQLFDDKVTEPVRFDTDNPSIDATIGMLYGFNFLKIPLLDKLTGQPPLQIQPAKRTLHTK